jgi:hypothetical protein
MKTILAILGLAAALAGCSSPNSGGYPLEFQKAAATTPGVDLSSSDGEAAIGRFRDFFQNVTPESIREKTAKLYAEDVWFNDTLKTLRGREAVEAYFLKELCWLQVARYDIAASMRSSSQLFRVCLLKDPTLI